LGLSHPPDPAHPHKHLPGVNPYVWAGLGVFLFLLLHVPAFRRGLWAGMKLAGRGLHALLVGWPRAFFRLAWVQQLLGNPWFQFVTQYVLRPLPWAALAVLCLRLGGAPPGTSLAAGAATFALASLILHSRVGLYLEEVAADHLVRTWRLLGADLLPGLFRWVLYVFRRLVDGVERLLYSVDEWLRFRSGEGRLALVFKPVLGLVWFGVTYVVRIVLNLFVEPTFNPIKHFPVVTVSAKLMLPFYLDWTRLWASQMEPFVGHVAARMLAQVAFFLIPGLSGFMVWELKENWRLYRANQSPTLDPEVVGHHGETVLRLLRPGLHSGTLPKLYARLRRAKGRSARRQHEALAGVEESLRLFAGRDLLAILGTSKAWSGAPPLEVGTIRAGSVRVRIELRPQRDAGGSVFVEFEEHAGWLLAGLSPHPAGGTWLGRVRPEQALAFRDALAGFYKLAGVALVREQLEALLPPGASYNVTEAGLVVWPGPGPEATYPLGPGPQLQPQPPACLPPLPAREVFYTQTPVLWEDWVRTWQRDHEGLGHEALLPETLRLLPDPVAPIPDTPGP
jgi:hypothetical protein